MIERPLPVAPTPAELARTWARLPALADGAVAEVAHQRLAEQWPLLARWVEINSYTRNHAGCQAVAAELEAALALPGLRGRRVVGRHAGDHLVWTTEAWGARPGVLLVGHHDTVFPPGSFEGFSCDAERIYGPGVLDMKGGLALVRTALAVLADLGELARLPLALVSVSDEETGTEDGRRALSELVGAAALGLVFEAGRADDSLVTRRKGTGKLAVVATGRAAHAGNDLSAGRNAIWALARFIDGAQRLSAADGAVTVNVGLVSGGTSVNTVPAHARCELDLRAATVAAGEHLLAALTVLAQQVSAQSEVALALEGGLRRQPLERTEASARLAAEWGALATAVGLSAVESPLVGGGSDANTLAEHGVPVLDGLGPRGRGFHTPQEYADLASFAPRLGALLAFLRGFAAGAGASASACQS